MKTVEIEVWATRECCTSLKIKVFERKNGDPTYDRDFRENNDSVDLSDYVPFYADIDTPEGYEEYCEGILTNSKDIRKRKIARAVLKAIKYFL